VFRRLWHAGERHQASVAESALLPYRLDMSPSGAWLVVGMVALAGAGAGAGAASGKPPPAGEEALSLVPKKPVTAASGHTWTWTDDGIRPGTGKSTAPHRALPWTFVVTRAGAKATLAVEETYAEGNALGRLYVLRGAGDGRVDVRLGAGAATPLTYDEGEALADAYAAEKHGTKRGSSSGWRSAPNGTLRVAWSSDLDGGELFAVVVGLYTRAVLWEE
jgi:hypothetical protein